MAEVWLRTNRRALLLGMIVPALVLLMGGWLLVASVVGQWWIGWTVLGGGAVAVALGLLAQLWHWLRKPRLAYADGHLLVYLEARPTPVPIEIVECFFIGQGASQLPKLEGREPETTNVIVRLAEAARDWRHRDVRPTLGHWCEGYITINGAWCEPVNGESLKRLNGRLVEVHREQRQKAGGQPAGGRS